jgi:hypothetical protein
VVHNVSYRFHQNAGKRNIRFFTLKTIDVFFSSRYVLVTFPRVPVRYNAPTYVERLLLPERFPTLFQNIVHSCEQNRNNN